MKYSIGTVVLLLGVIGILIYCTYSMMTFPMHPSAVIIVVIGVCWFIYSGNLGEFTGFVLKNKNFITKGGGIGVVRDVYIHQGGMVTYEVTTWGRTKGVKERKRKENALGGFASFFSATTTVLVTDKAYRFHDLPEHFCDLREGVVFYDGTFSGIEPPSQYEELKLQLDSLFATLSKAQTIFEKAKSVAAASAQEANLDLLEAIKKAEIALAGIMKTTKPPAPRQYLTPPPEG